ncbi:hypothetical protein CRU95_00805 [Arcobacter sp. F2176]|nr:hypothetical protein CRU95_00805 [Arcobacter sp. F2176]
MNLKLMGYQMTRPKNYTTSYPNIYYYISPKTNKKVYFGRYYKDRKQKTITLGSSLNTAIKKMNLIKKGISKKDSSKLVYNKEILKTHDKHSIEVLYFEYIDIEGKKWSTQELKTKKSRFKRWILPHFGKMNIHDVRYSHIQKFINDIDDKKLLARKTQENLKSSIQSFFKFCIKEGYLNTGNPAQYVDIKAYDNHVPMTLTLEQIIRFYQTIIDIDCHSSPNHSANLDNRKKRLMLILMIHGRRWNEAQNLCWSEIDFISNLYIIPAHKSKTKKTQKHKMTDFLRLELMELKVISNDGEDFLFINPQTKNPYSSINTFFKTIKKKADIPKTFRCQDFRHVVGTVAYQNLGIPLENIRDVLAHGSVTTTEIYSDKDSLNSRKVLTSLFELFGF